MVDLVRAGRDPQDLTRFMALEPRQDELLRPIVDGPTLGADTLRATGALTESSADATPELDGTES